MKKVLAIFLALIITLSTLPLMSFAADENVLKFSIATDIQSWSDYVLTGKVYKNMLAVGGIDTPYSHIGSSGIMGFEAGAITDEFFSKMASNDSELSLCSVTFQNSALFQNVLKWLTDSLLLKNLSENLFM